MCTIKQGLFNEAECHKNGIYNKTYQDAKLTTGKIQPFFKGLHYKKWCCLDATIDNQHES